MAPALTGGEAVVRMLQAHGVRYCFGMGGFQALPYYDALARQHQVRHVLVRDEKHGAFAADGYARVSNRPAVADATLGPGATNLISGAAESFGASVPSVLLTAEVNSAIATRGATQESDQLGMLRPTCKATVEINRIERVPELIRRAFNLATGGRPGPVNLNIPEDVFHGRHEFAAGELWADPAAAAAGSRRTRPDQRQVEAAALLLRKAKRPVLIAGGGVHLSQAYAELAELSKLLAIPVATTISGKGALSELDDLSAGICGRYSRCANELIVAADVLLVVGCKLGEIATNRWTLIPPGAELIQVDVDPAEIGKYHRASVGLWGDAKLALADLAAAVRPGTTGARRRRAVESLRAAHRRWLEQAKSSYRSSQRPVHMVDLLEALRACLPPEAILVADGGFAAHWSALLYDVRVAGRTYVANRGHAAIGYGLAGAIGAKLAAPGVPVVALCGDNGFAMSIAELETARRAGAHVISVVVNNQALGYVKALQSRMYDRRFISVDFLDVDFAAAARAFGCHGCRVEEKSGLVPALQAALAEQCDRPAVIDVLTTRDPDQMLPGVDLRAQQSASRG